MSRSPLFALALGLVFAVFSADGPARADVPADRASYAEALKVEAGKAGLPVDIADAVMAVESGYDRTRIGGVGEIGLMQVRPATAAMLGFKGSATDLAVPAANIHYGVTYLAAAWRQAHGDLCRALMKYRAGHGEEVMSPLSVIYCQRARAHLAAVGSPFADAVMPPAVAEGAAAPRAAGARWPGARTSGAAFWAAHEARIRRINARIERRWRVIAAR